jgi:hypothetical protein
MQEQGKGGRPTHEPTDQTTKTVEAMASYGIPQDEIAAVLGIDPKTLRKHYANALAIAATKANALVAQSLFAKATAKEITGPSVTAAIFWLKARAGWRTSDPQRANDDWPSERQEPALGKKEQAAQAALSAGIGTDWGDDLLVGIGGRLPN